MSAAEGGRGGAERQTLRKQEEERRLRVARAEDGTWKTVDARRSLGTSTKGARG